MIKKFVAGLGLISTVTANAQINGITHIADTSFTNYSALQKIIKQYPEAKPVEHLRNGSIGREDLSYFSSGHLLNCTKVSPREINNYNGVNIFILHGGGWRSGNPLQHLQLAEHLALRGYTCFLPQYRLSTDTLYPAPVDDIRQAMLQFGSPAHKTVIMGFSAGGELAAYIGATHTSKIDAVVDIDGTLSFVHPESAEGNDTKGTSAASYWLGVPKAANPELWKEASPLTHFGAGDPAFLFINSSVARMHAGRDDGIRILQANGIHAEVFEFTDAPHVFPLFHPWFLPTVDKIDEFLIKTFSK